MEVSNRILSDITVHMKYARYLEDKKRRENWTELVTRNMQMHIKKYPQLEQEIIENYKFANDRTIMLKTDFQVDFVHFEEAFVQAIEALLELNFNKNQKQIIEWWLYDKWQLDGTVLQLNNTETDEELPSDTPEELWNLVQTLK